MALTGLDIFKKLPKTNCGECGVPTCLAFAMRLAAGQATLDACPYVTDEVKAELSEASAPLIRLVTIGTGDNALKIGEEQVMFRHDKTFYHQPGLAILIKDDMSDGEISAKLDQIKNAHFDRVGQLLRADLVAIENSSGDTGKLTKAVQTANKAGFPLVLISTSPDALKSALEICKANKPLICSATKDNYEVMTALAKESGCPLVVSSTDDLESLADLSEKVAATGVSDIVLDPGIKNLQETLKNLVFIRRSGLKSKFRPLGFPIITFPGKQTDDEDMEALFAAVYIAKYAGIVVLNSLEPWKALPLFVLRQNIYTDPQKPMQVDEGIYPIGEPKEDSPVLLTTNFSLTYFTVSGEVEASRVPSWLCIMDVEGLSVLTAWAAGKFVPEKIAPFIKKSGVADKVKHRKLVIPGYLAQISGELQEELGDWQVLVGPREAGDIPVFLKQWQV